MANPNPQNIAFARWEAPRLTVTMSPPTDITGWTFTLTIKKDGIVSYQNSTPTVTNLTTGIFYWDIPSTSSGGLVVGQYHYDVFSTNTGNEKQLVYGILTVRFEQWKT